MTSQNNVFCQHRKYANSPMQNLFLSIDLVLPRSVIGAFPVSGWFLVSDRVVCCLKPFGIRSFHQEVIGVIMRNKQGTHSRAAVGIKHFFKQLVVQVEVLFLKIVVESDHDNLRGFVGCQTSGRFTVVAASTVWRKALLRIARLCWFELSASSNSN